METNFEQLEDLVKEALYKTTRGLTYDVESIYHYTNIEALFNGIICKEPLEVGKELSILSTCSEYLNDPTEVEYGKTIVTNIVSKYESLKLRPSLGIKAENYVTSFSLNKDSLPMWSMYGKNGNGIALEFDLQALMWHMGMIYPCIYKQEDAERLFCEILSMCEEKLGTKLDKDARYCVENIIYSYISTLIKVPAYEHEREMRFYTKYLYRKDIQFRYANNLIIPFIKTYLPKDTLKAIIIGPNNSMERTKLSLRMYLDAMGMKNVELVESEIPYRS